MVLPLIPSGRMLMSIIIIVQGHLCSTYVISAQHLSVRQSGNIELSVYKIVVHSRDDEDVGANHEVNSPKNQSQFF